MSEHAARALAICLGVPASGSYADSYTFAELEALAAGSSPAEEQSRERVLRVSWLLMAVLAPLLVVIAVVTFAAH